VASDSETWWERGACRTVPPQIFDVPDFHRAQARDWSEARAVCARCPVRAECLEWVLGMEHSEWHPFFAAGQPPERLAALRRKTRRVS
jgi:WhiB family redox-sensing transcriptional regulator